MLTTTKLAEVDHGVAAAQTMWSLDPERARMFAHTAMSSANEVAMDESQDWETRAKAMRLSIQATTIVQQYDAQARAGRRRQ